MTTQKEGQKLKVRLKQLIKKRKKDEAVFKKAYEKEIKSIEKYGKDMNEII